MPKPKENFLATPCTALELDSRLNLHIGNYLSIEGNSTRTLVVDISQHIKALYAALPENGMLADDIEADIRKNTPSRTLLMDYYRDSTPMCTRYINAVAVFFGQDYVVSKYDPAQDLIARFKSKQ